MTGQWTPLVVQDGAEPGALRGSVPDVLEAPLRQWIQRVAGRSDVDTQRLMIMLDLVLPASYSEEHKRAVEKYVADLARYSAQHAQQREKAAGAELSSAPVITPGATLANLYLGPIPPVDPVPAFLSQGTGPDTLLQVIHGLLHLMPHLPPSPASADPATRLVNAARRKLKGNDREILAQLLDDGRMLYRIRADGRGLERRVSVPSSAHAQLSADAAIRAGRHIASERLVKAWQALYSPDPDPGACYSHAVRAVEATAVPFFLPAAHSPTLGTVRGHLDQARAKYELVIADQDNNPGSVDVIVTMIGTLWFGHRDRHEGGPTSAPISPESAEAALSIATTLVHLISTGSIRKKPLRDRRSG